MILPKDRDPRFITIRRGGTLTDSDHQLLALWAASCAEHVLALFEAARPSDARPRRKGRERAQGDSSAGGSATSSRRRFVSSYSTTSGCGTTSAGRCSTAESASGRQRCPTSASSGRRELSPYPALVEQFFVGGHVGGDVRPA